MSNEFWAAVTKTDTCWLWGGDLTEKGYGRHYEGTRQFRAHRFAYEMEVGPIPPGLVLDHVCHVKHCVRPQHLRPVTKKENAENRAGAQRNSKSGIRGVVWEKRRNKWRVSCASNGREFHGGYYADLKEAAEAARQLRLSLFTHNDKDRLKESA